MKKSRNIFLGAFILLVLSFCCHGQVAAEFILAPENPNSLYGYDPRVDLPKDLKMVNRPFLGLGIRFTKKYGALVNGISAGPMEGTFERSPYCDRGDIVESIDDQPISHKVLKEILSSKKPGDKVTIKFLRTKPNVGTMLPTPGKERVPSEAVITLGRMSEWTGPTDDILKDEDLPDLDGVVPNLSRSTPAEKFITKNLKEKGIQVPVEKLKKAFWRDFCSPSYSKNMLPQMAYGFKYPFRLIELQNTVLQPVKHLTKNPDKIYEVIAQKLNLNVPEAGPVLDLENPQRAMDALSEVVDKADELIKKAFSKFSDDQKERFKTLTYEMLSHMSRHEWITRLPHPEPYIAVTQASPQVDLQSLISAAALFSGAIAKSNPVPKSALPAQVPDEIRNFVKGDILAARKIKGHWIVYGGFGPNSYNMDQIDVVIDPGGNDQYIYNDSVSRGLKLIVDMEGNDLYLPSNPQTQKQGSGPAAGVFGISLIVDYQGNDVYLQNSLCGIGAGIFGFGVLVDYQGQDQYMGSSWSVGAGLYGAGVILDLGKETDTYQSVTCSQGLGCSRGFGLLLDNGGNDLYQTGGMQSSYGTLGASLSLSQGVGLDISGYDDGGIGILCDLGGNDRYLGGEFSQGCGYGGFGILYDRDGNDLYYADRYSQGSAVHQALGILVDEKGDDTYYALSEVCQGAAWDRSVGVLFDRSGNDSYASSGTCQGGAAMQGIGWLIDLGGQDRYSSQNQTSQGFPSENDYSYEETGCFSFSWLLDSGGQDSYSQPRRNDSIKALGRKNLKEPEKSRLNGLFMDVNGPITFWDFR